MPAPPPVIGRAGLTRVSEISFSAITDVEKIPEYFNRLALLTGAEQGGDGELTKLSVEIQHRRFNRRHRMNRRALIKSLQTPPTRIAITKTPAHGLNDGRTRADRLADDQFARLLKSLANFFSARHFAGPSAAGAISED